MVALARVSLAMSTLSTAHASLVLEHAQHLGLRLIISHARHSDQFDPSLIIILAALLEVVTLARVHDEDDAIVHRRKLLIREAWRIHLKLGLTNVRLILGHVVPGSALPR